MYNINKKYHNLKNFSDSFKNAKPFPHVILDDFLNEKYFSNLKKYFNEYSNTNLDGRNFNSNAEKSKWISLNSNLPEEISKIISTLNDKMWISNLIRFTGLKSLNATSVGNKLLANYHEMKPGGVLTSHVDHSSEPVTGMPHILNIILFISPQWESNYGGATLFYDQWGKKVIKKIEYIPNRGIIFLHNPYSFHGVECLNLNHNYLRRSIYVDYYSDSFQPYKNFNLNSPNHWFEHGTTFKLENFIDYLRPSHFNYTKALIKYNINRILSN